MCLERVFKHQSDMCIKVRGLSPCTKGKVESVQIMPVKEMTIRYGHIHDLHGINTCGACSHYYFKRPQNSGILGGAFHSLKVAFLFTYRLVTLTALKKTVHFLV